MMRSVRNFGGTLTARSRRPSRCRWSRLIAAGGIAFDYARLAAMDTELQDAADQAALAAASQLDGQYNGARAQPQRTRLLTNKTLFANDNRCDGRAITMQTKAPSTPPERPTSEANS